MKTMKKALALLLSLCMLLTALPVTAMAAGISFETDNGSSFNDGYNNVISQKNYAIAPGVTEQTIVLNNDTGENQNVGHIMQVDLNNSDVTLLSGYKNMDPTQWGTQATSKQAEAAEEKLGINVVGAINTNLSWASDEPLGMLVINGEVYHEANNGQAYFVLTKDGKAELRDSSTPLQGNEWQATSTFGWLVRNGVSVYSTADHATGSRAPRTAIGIKADGSVILFVVDGRQAPYSVGMSMYELAQTMLSLGCVQAVNCDGGGTSTFVTEREGSGDLKVQNSPSDGVERPTLGSLMVVSKAKPTGEFDHAALSPNNDLYTPGSSVQFTAAGVDSAGAAADLPEDITWRLSSDCTNMGTIDQTTGLFAGADRAVGKVTVELCSGGNVVGTTSIELVHPDTLQFQSKEMSLGFNVTEKLAMYVKYQGRDVNYNAGDFTWTQSDDRMGTFNADGTYTTNDGLTISGTIQVYYTAKPEVADQLTMVIGKLPVVVWDFEDVTVTDPDTGETTVIPAEEYYTIDQKDANGNRTSLLYTSNYGRGGVQSAEIVSIDDDEPVRMGTHSLKLNYDFRNCGAVTEGACIGTSEAFSVPGAPTAIGVWVYAPEGTGVLWNGDGTTAGLWLRGYYKDSTGSTCQYDFTFEPKVFGTDKSTWPDEYPGIWWEGWHYCEAKLNPNAPYSIIPGMTFRLMYVYATKMGEKTAGSIYFDNFQFVYGTNIDDVDAPYVNEITVNYGDGQRVELTDGVTVPSNKLGFFVDYMDVENKYTSGVDPDTTRVYIDGVNVIDDDYYNTTTDNAGRNTIYGITLANGRHTITVYAKDKAGNELKETRSFFVQGEDDLSRVPTVSLASVESSAMLGGKVTLELKNSDPASTSSYSLGVKLDKNFPDYKIEFADGYEGTYQYNKLTGVIQLTVSKTAENAGETVATITVDVPTNLKKWDTFSYTLDSCQYVVGDLKYTYSQKTVELSVDCMYTITADPILVGEHGTIQVTGDVDTLKDIGIYLEDGTLIGTTDAQGVLVTDRFSTTAGNYTIYAKDTNGLLSFTYVVSSYNASGDASLAPYGLMSHASGNGGLEHSVTWFTNPGTAAQMLQYKVQGSDTWTTVDATSKRMTFSKGGNTMTTLHSAIVTGLDSGKTYVYRVGDGTVWSAEYTFKTKAESGATKFFVLGDIQTEDITDVQGIVAQLKDQGYDFAIQTGDAVDDATSYTDWMGIVGLFGAESLGQTDVIHVLGNHEFAGDAAAMSSTLIYNLPTSGNGGHYSVVYGNVYVAVINYTSNRQELAAALEWLKQDAEKSDATWKVLTIHQPPYYTNTSGGNAEIHDMVPAAVEAAGIDFVFSGHDHSYARTKPLSGGQVDEQNGVVYIISGSTGEKAYSVTNNPDFHFDTVVDDYESVYLTVETDENKITVKSYDGGKGNALLDSYTKEKARCANDEHTYVYDRENGTLKCSACGYSENAVDGMYSGWAADSESNRAMYFIGGQYQTGYVSINSKQYFFDETGLGFEGEYTIGGETCVFSQGQFVNSTTADVRLAGQCGNDVWFVLYTDGLLKLSGTGPMYAATSGNAMPWYSLRTSIKSLYIGSGITSLANYAFTRASNLKTVEFEANSQLKTIGKQAFLKNYSLTEIVIPDSVTSMGSYIFSNCTRLTKATLPSGTSFLTSRIFENCTSLTSVYIPDDVSKIADTTFYGCSNVVLDVAGGSYAEQWATSHNVSYTARGAKVLYSGTCGENITWELYSDGKLILSGSGDMDVISTTTGAPWYSERARITEIQISKDITSLSKYAFYKAMNVERVVFEEGSVLKTIGNQAFFKCTSLKEIELPDSVTSTGTYVFAECTALEKAVLPEGISKVNTRLFNKCGNLAYVYIPDGVTNIVSTAFSECSKVVLDVAGGSYAEQWATSHNVSYVARNTGDPQTADTSESLENAETVVLPEVAAEISAYASNSCGAELTWKIEGNVLEISGIGEMDSYALDAPAPWAAYANEIECVIVGNNVQTIGAYAFNGLEKLASVSFEDDSHLTVIEEYAFAGCSALTAIELPDKLEKLGEGAFADCEKLAQVILPDSVNEFEVTMIESENLEISIAREPVAVFNGCDMTVLVLIVTNGSEAERYATENGITVQYNKIEAFGENSAADIERPEN